MIINVNNIDIHYEVFGRGPAVILLHGNGEDYTIFEELIKKLRSNYKVYAIDSRCHGESTDAINISYDLMANDVIEFIKKLDLKNPSIYGYSDGGIVALLVAAREPELVSQIIVSGANITPDGIKFFERIAIRFLYFIKKDKVTKMMINEPNIPIKELQGIECPVHLIVGQKDMIKLKHTNLIKENIKNATLEILPGETHSSYIENSEKIYDVIKPYLDENNNKKK